jgi:hypothetical protein
MKTFPSAQFSKVLPISNDKDYFSESQSLKTIAVSVGAQRWEFDLTTAWERLSLTRSLWMFLNARSRSQKFTIQLPIFDTANGAVSGVVKAAASYSIGTSDVVLTNYVPAAGDFIQFVGHSKVYGIEEVNGNISTIYPPLLKSVLLNETVTVNNLKFTVRRKDALSKLENKKGNLAKIKFKIIEAF